MNQSKPMHSLVVVGYTAKLNPEGIHTTSGIGSPQKSRACVSGRLEVAEIPGRGCLADLRWCRWPRAWDASQSKTAQAPRLWRCLSRAELEDVFTPKGPKRRVGMLEVGELFGLIVALGKRVQDIHPLRFPERIWELHARHLNGVWGRIATCEQGQRENPHRNVEHVAWCKG